MSSMPGVEEMSNDDGWIEHFEHFCGSKSLSLKKMRRMTEGVRFDTLRKSSFLHIVCMNERVTKDIVEYLLDLCPSAVNFCTDIPDEFISGFPLHLACYNKHCSDEVIELLIRRGGREILSHLCAMEFEWTNVLVEFETGGLPLHYYLTRQNVQLDTVKLLADDDPRIISTADEETQYTPIYTLLHNSNIGAMFDVVEYFFELSPSSLQAVNETDQVPLHVACGNKNITAVIVRYLVKVSPRSVYVRDIANCLPIHSLCEAPLAETKSDDAESREILTILLEAYPDSVTQVQEEGALPLHLAASNKSPRFCEILVAASKHSVREVDEFGHLPFHFACRNGHPDTLKYLSEVYPESIAIPNNNGLLPIHEAASFPGENTASIIDFLFIHDPECASRVVASPRHNEGWLPLHFACDGYNKSGVAELLFDLYPEAIYTRNKAGKLPLDVLREMDDELPIDDETGLPYNEELRQANVELISFLRTQANYARLARDNQALLTPDSNGNLPLHHALHSNAPLGSIKLLVKGNPDATAILDNKGMHPVEIASHSGTVGTVKFLLGFHDGFLNNRGVNGNYPLHHACRGGNCDLVKYLLESPMASVSERNKDGLLPIQMFCSFVNEQIFEDESSPYLETIWRLLLAYPETVLNW